MKANKKIVVSNRYDKVLVRYQAPQHYPASSRQIAQRDRFARANALALADMLDSQTKSRWQFAADVSNGRYSSPRNAAFAFYYRSIE